ncbi:2'-deoxymugineic-acid 2'-dioxygenase-like [Triticum dicoccoides]|uniref:2'-deoxymugineic-acid 2'-dioxygenase-like n=1 Tax=Triticum dicoccoides TaxID=85692 RepID=UPI001891A4BD|nr:2'-deoxymugineic-acid 2'-dioxygenase-like [Triticum dicoccoides]
MEKLRWSAESSSQGAVPERFLMRLAAASPTLVSLPVIDLSRGRDEVRHAVLHAGKEIGFFQVINHGMPERTMREMEMACGDFFRLPTTDKATLYSEDTGQTNRLFSSTMYRSAAGESYSCHCLHLACHPVERTKPAWPEKPAGLRPALENFIVPARSIAMELLRLLCEGVGLRPDYFEGGLTGGDVIVDASHYPPCADPGLTLGLPPRYDRNLITVLLQPGYVRGLQVLYNGDWVDVEPIPGALGISFGHQLEIATNGALRSVERRTVANAVVGRTSVAATIMPTMDCVVGPAKELVGEGRPARYRSVAFRDFMHVYKTLGACKESVEEALKISPYQASSWYMSMDTTNE